MKSLALLLTTCLLAAQFGRRVDRGAKRLSTSGFWGHVEAYDVEEEDSSLKEFEEF